MEVRFAPMIRAGTTAAGLRNRSAGMKSNEAMDHGRVKPADRREAKAPWLRAHRAYLLVAAGGRLL